MPRPRRVGRPHPAGAGASARYGAGLGIARFQEAAYKYIMEGFESQAQISRRDPGGRDLHSCKRVRTISNVLSDESGWAFSRRHAGRRVAVGRRLLDRWETERGACPRHSQNSRCFPICCYLSQDLSIGMEQVGCRAILAPCNATQYRTHTVVPGSGTYHMIMLFLLAGVAGRQSAPKPAC